MQAVRKPACRNHLHIFRQLEWSCFSAVQVPEIDSSRISVGDIFAIGRDHGCRDRHFRRVRRDPLLDGQWPGPSPRKSGGEHEKADDCDDAGDCGTPDE
jgi:hypothetical protein